MDPGTALIPVLTLLLGAALAAMARRPQARNEAGDTLAELPRRSWTKFEPNAWLDLRVYLARLRIRLRAAGVPIVLIEWLQATAVDHWQQIKDSNDPEAGLYVEDDSDEVRAEAEAAVADWLDRSWHLRRRALALQKAYRWKKQQASQTE